MPFSKTASLATLLSAIASLPLHAQDISSQQQCLIDRLKSSADEVTVAEIKAWCDKSLEQQQPADDVVDVDAVAEQPGALTQRIRSEQVTEFDPYVLTPHRRNYILPVLTTNNINRICME